MEDFDKELLHYAKGQTKKNAKYKSRKMVNGRWVYDYGNKKSPYQKGAEDYADYPKATNSNDSIESVTGLAKMSDDLARFAGQNDDPYNRERMHYLANRQYSAAESAKRQKNSWQRKFNEKHYNYKASARFNKVKAKGKALIKKYIIGEPGKVYPVNSAKEKAEYEKIRRKNMSKGRKFIEDYIIGREGKVTTR